MKTTFTLAYVPTGLVGASQLVRGPAAESHPGWQWAAWRDDNPHPGGWAVAVVQLPLSCLPNWAEDLGSRWHNLDEDALANLGAGGFSRFVALRDQLRNDGVLWVDAEDILRGRIWNEIGD